MDYTYLDNFTKESVDDMQVVQNALKETGAILDSKLFPLIEEAEKGSFLAQAELYEMFVFGFNDIKPNYELAKRYTEKLQAANLAAGEPIRITEGMKAVARMHYEFEEYGLASDALLECMKYMVTIIGLERY